MGEMIICIMWCWFLVGVTGAVYFRKSHQNFRDTLEASGTEVSDAEMKIVAIAFCVLSPILLPLIIYNRRKGGGGD